MQKERESALGSERAEQKWDRALVESIKKSKKKTVAYKWAHIEHIS